MASPYASSPEEHPATQNRNEPPSACSNSFGRTCSSMKPKASRSRKKLVTPIRSSFFSAPTSRGDVRRYSRYSAQAARLVTLMRRSTRRTTVVGL